MRLNQHYMDVARRQRREHDTTLRWLAIDRIGEYYVIQIGDTTEVYHQGRRGVLVALPWVCETVEAARNVIYAHLAHERQPSSATE